MAAKRIALYRAITMILNTHIVKGCFAFMDFFVCHYCNRIINETNSINQQGYTINLMK